MLSRLQTVARHYPAVLITGARQTGKTTLLREAFPEAAFTTLDLPSAAYEAEHNGLSFLRSLGSNSTPIILDEVQYAPQIFRTLKMLVDEDRHNMGRFLMTGSQKFALMQSVSESMAGRVAIIELESLSASEIMDSRPMSVPPVEEVMWRGGYPELWRSPDMSPRMFYGSYLATYLERDVRQLINVTSLRDFERFIRMCALRTGNLVNLDGLASDVGITGNTAKQWLSVLEASNIIQLVQPYLGNHGKRLIKTPKLFFKDTGLAAFLLGIPSPEALVSSPFVGALWETFVLGQLIRSREAEDMPAEIYFWRDAHGTEVDFAIWLNGRLHLIECKWSENGGESSHLKPMHKVRSDLGQTAAATHLLVCRTPINHWHPHDPTVRVVNGYRFRDWYSLPIPEQSVLREEPPPAAKRTKKTVSVKRKSR
ncbi:MAG: ATP-binding protein [Verrucomicrobiaceae bacterium]|nr:ATP-binding protein [Verrucomicrobiaceae bacterium]